MKQRTLRKAIRENQRHYKYERMLRRIRLRIFDYEDDGNLDKAHQVIAKIKVICGPRWERRAKRNEDKQLSRLRWH